MDKSAIQAITALSVATVAQAALNENEIDAVVLEENYQLKSLESLKLRPDLFRAQFNTSALSQFIDYVDDAGSSNTGVFIDQEKMTAQAIIDMGHHDAPYWGKHRAHVALKQTPAYAALIRLNNGHLSQQDFIDFAEDWSANIAFYYDDNETAHDDATFKKTIKTLRKIKLSATAVSENSVENFSATRSAMEDIEVTAGNEKPPAGFIFRVVPHDGFDEVAFDCPLRAITDTKAVRLKYRIMQLDQQQLNIAEQFKAKITNNIKGGGISIYIGNMDYQK